MSSRLVCIKIGTWRESARARNSRAHIEAAHARHDHVEHDAVDGMRANRVIASCRRSAVITRKPAISSALPTNSRAPGSSSTTSTVAAVFV